MEAGHAMVVCILLLLLEGGANGRSLLLIYYVFSLGSNTIWNCESSFRRPLEGVLIVDTPFATSAFGAHSVVATIDVINGIVSGVSQPFIAKVYSLLEKPLVSIAAD